MMNEKAIEIGKRVQAIRKKTGLNQDNFGERFSLSQNQISRIESGHSMVTTDFVLKLHDLYGVDPTYLLLGVSYRGLDPEIERFISWYEKLESESEKEKAGKFWETIIDYIER